MEVSGDQKLFGYTLFLKTQERNSTEQRVSKLYNFCVNCPFLTYYIAHLLWQYVIVELLPSYLHEIIHFTWHTHLCKVLQTRWDSRWVRIKLGHVELNSKKVSNRVNNKFIIPHTSQIKQTIVPLTGIK